MVLASARRGVLALLVCWVALGASRAAADEHVLEDLPSVHEACRRSEEPGRRVLHVLEVPSFRFDGYDREGGRLLVDTRRNLRALRGAVEVLPKDLEDVAFVASPERARELRRRGRALRLGFFLGFDGEGQPCVMRAAVGVTLVRAELAFAELVDADGRVVAREDMDRLRAWLDDEEQDTLPGEGPRAAVVAIAVERGATAPDDALRARAVTQALGVCYAREPRGDAMAVARLRTDAAGRTIEKSFSLTDLASDAVGECVLAALASVSLPAGERVWRVQVRFAE